MSASPKVTRHKVSRSWEEFQCEHCGSPVYVGEAFFFAESALADGAGCTEYCALQSHRNWADRMVGEGAA